MANSQLMTYAREEMRLLIFFITTLMSIHYILHKMAKLLTILLARNRKMAKMPSYRIVEFLAATSSRTLVAIVY